jgi:hypothetical protein
MSFRVGDKVRTRENHSYLNISTSDIGEVISGSKYGVDVKFMSGRTILFDKAEVTLANDNFLEENKMSNNNEFDGKARAPEYITDNKSTGIKHDQEKPDMSLLSTAALIKMAEVMTFGKKKYSAHNWRGGFVWSRPLSAAFRHLVAYIGGEDKDPETGLSHLSHCACCIMFLLEFEETRRDLDDRYKSESKS